MTEVAIINLVLSVIVLVLGIWAYRRRQAVSGLLLGVAFGLFAVSHLLTALGLAASLEVLLITIRTAGYLAAIIAAWKMGKG